MALELDGRVVLITGAARGQGLKAAQLFARHGAAVVITDLTAAGVNNAVTSIVDEGGNALGFVGDVTNAAHVKGALELARQRYGGLDILYNNAGIGYSAIKEMGIAMDDIVSCTEPDWNRIVDINLRGVFLFCKYGIPLLIERGGGVVINTASTAAIRGLPDAHAYSASKGAVVSLTRSLAHAYGPKGIRANVICPGVIDTEMVHELLITNEAVKKGIEMSTPLRRVGRPEEIAELALFLAGDRSSFITGQVIVADGGSTA